ncbi:MAG: flagellar basal body P-ring formation chaperone FlgA [Motiliproteus sp.]
MLTKGSPIQFCCLFLLASISSAQANSSAILEQADAFLRQQINTPSEPGLSIEIHFRQPNSKLQLTKCAEPIQFSSSRPIEVGAVNLRASCNYPRRWSHFLHGEVNLLRQVLVSSRPLSKGSTLRIADLKYTKLDQNALRNGYFTEATQITGHQLNRSVSAGKPINQRMLSAPFLVAKGDTVTIQAGNNDVSVEMSGTALEAGKHNDQILVENNRSGKTVKARVISRGHVKVMR